MAMKGWSWNPYVRMMVPTNSAFDIKPDVKVVESYTPSKVDLSIVDKLRRLEYINTLSSVAATVE